MPEKQGGKLIKAGSSGKGFPDSPAQLRLIRFKLGLPGRDTVRSNRGVGSVKGSLSFLLRPILTLGNALFAAVQKVYLVKPLAVAHLHDFGFQIVHSCVRTAVLAACFPVRWPVHVGQHGNLRNPQTVNDDMHMDIFGVAVSVRVGADKGLVSGEMLGAELLAQLLRPINGQAVVRAVPWVKADDVVVALYVLPFLVLAVAEIGAHTGNGKILPATIQRGYAVVYPRYEPPVCVKGGLHGKLVMLECEVFFSVPVVGIFRADMFEYRQRLHLLSARLQTSRRQGRRRLPALPFPAPGRGFRIRSGSGQSGLSCRRFSRTLP